MPRNRCAARAVTSLGVAYKRDIDDVRESPALDIMLLLERLGAVVTFSDPYVRRIQTHNGHLDAQDMLSSVAAGGLRRGCD